MAVCKSLGAVIFTVVLAQVMGENQKAILYDQFNGEGGSLVISNEYIPDLNNNSFGNRAHSACVTGVWIFYEETNYNPTGKGKVEYIFGTNNFCSNFKTVRGYVSSLRYAGHPKDYRADSITIYEHNFFQGREEYAITQLNNLDILQGEHKSIIITGTSDWTVFDQPNFQGNIVCLKVPASGELVVPAFIDDISKHDESSIPHGGIKSVRKGCTSNGKVVKLTSFRVL